MDAQVKKELDDLRGLLEKAAQPRSAAASAKSLFAGGYSNGDWTKNPWPQKHLEQLARAYGEGQAQELLVGRYGRPARTIGWGPYLAKMAGLSSPSLGTVDRSYTSDQLEAESGFVTIHKASQGNVKTPFGEVRKVALSESSGVTGGYVIPPQFQNELLTIAAEDAFIEPRCKILPMTSRTATWPMLDITASNYGTGVTPYLGGVVATWQPEAATINETEPQFKMSTWTAWDLVMYTVSSNQLLADNAIGLDALLTQLFGMAITWYKEYAFLNGLGAGSSMPLGVFNAPATYVQARTSPGKFLLSDAAAMLARLQIRSWDDACWIMHQSVIPQLIQMTNGATNSPFLVWANPTPGTSMDGPASQKLPKAFLHGLPIFWTEKVPTLGTKGDVSLIDWGRYVVGQRMDMQIDVSKDFLFRTNQLAWRVVCRADGQPWLNGPIYDANGWVSSPFVVLNT